ADVISKLAQAFQKIAMALPGFWRTHAVGDGPLLRGSEHDEALFQSQLVALLVQRGEFIQQMLSTAQTDVAAQIGGHRILALIQYVQEGERGIQALAGPGRIVANSRGAGGAVNASGNVGHRCSPCQWPM